MKLSSITEGPLPPPPAPPARRPNPEQTQKLEEAGALATKIALGFSNSKTPLQPDQVKQLYSIMKSIYGVADYRGPHE